MSKSKATEQINAVMGQQKKSSNKKILLIIMAVVVICVALVLCYVFFWNDTKTYNQVVTEDNVDEIIAQLDDSERTPIGSYEVVMNTKWTFEDTNSSSSNAYVENSVNNQNTVYFTITPENDTDNIVFTSPNIPVGGKLRNIKLEKPLKKGTHNMLLKYHLLDETEKETSFVTVKVKVTIKN